MSNPLKLKQMAAEASKMTKWNENWNAKLKSILL